MQKHRITPAKASTVQQITSVLEVEGTEESYHDEILPISNRICSTLQKSRKPLSRNSSFPLQKEKKSNPKVMKTSCKLHWAWKRFIWRYRQKRKRFPKESFGGSHHMFSCSHPEIICTVQADQNQFKKHINFVYEENNSKIQTVLTVQNNSTNYIQK